MINKAKKIEHDGILFPSTYECDFYKALKKMEVPFEYGVKVLLTPPTMKKDVKKLLLSSGAAREISLTIDFVAQGLYGKIWIDTKPSKFAVREDSHLKYKLFKFQLAEKQAWNDQIKFIYQNTDGKTLLKLAALNQKELFLKTLFSTANF